MLVKPRPGCIVRDPISKRTLPPEGAEVPVDSYWSRRLACGDVVIVQVFQIPDAAGKEQ